MLKEWSFSRMVTTALEQTDQPWAFSIQLMQAEAHNLFSRNSNWNTVDPSHLRLAHSNISTLNFMSVSFFLLLTCQASNKHLHLLFLLSLLIQMLLYKVIIAFHELSHAILEFFFHRIHKSSLSEREAKAVQHAVLPLCPKGALGAWCKKDIVSNQTQHLPMTTSYKLKYACTFACFTHKISQLILIILYTGDVYCMLPV